VEHFFVEVLVSFFTSHAQEDVTANKLVDNLVKTKKYKKYVQMGQNPKFQFWMKVARV